MESIFSYIAESLFCGALFYILFVLLVSGKCSYNFQRGYLLLSSLFTAIFPLISIPTNMGNLFLLTLPEITIVSKGGTAIISNNGIATIAGAGNANLLLILYFSVFAFFILLFLLQLLKIVLISFKGERSRSEAGTIIRSDMVNTPFSFFNLIFLRKGVKAEDAGYIISHERAHVERLHSLDVIFISVVASFQWFNPFIYLFKGSLVSIHEYQADRDVLKRGYSITYYRNLMLSSQFGLTPFVANRLNNSLTIKRLKKMENLNEKRNRLINVLLVSLATFALFFVVSCKNIDKTDEQAITPPVSGQVPKDSATIATKATDATEEPFVLVEEMPQFPGGDKALLGFIAKNIKYPPTAMKKGIQGKVILKFVVSKTGSVENIKVLKSVDPECSKEAIRVIQLMPKWKPGKQNGVEVPVYFVLPVMFRLE